MYNKDAIFISYSKINDFETCPQLFYYRNIYKNPKTGYKIQLINPSLSVGGAIHDIIEEFYRNKKEDRTNKLLYQIFKKFWENIKGEKGGFKDYKEEEENKERAILMLKNFYTNKEFLNKDKLKTNTFPKYNLENNLILIGKLDFVEKDNDSYIITDFKTGKNEEKETSLQMPIYALLLEGEFGTQNIKAQYWYLDSGTSPTLYNLPKKEESLNKITMWGERIKLAQKTNSYRCKSGLSSCWACRDILEISKGKGKLVWLDSSRSQEIYIINY